MRTFPSLIIIGALLGAVPSTRAQRTTTGRSASKSADASSLVTRMMKFDANKDGKLTKAEVTDDRLLRTFDRADADQDGTVTRAELTSLAARERASARAGSGGGGRGGFGDGPPPGGGRGMGMGGPPRPKPGEVLPQMLQQRLKLSSDQQSQLKALQKDVDAKLAKILTDDQKAQLKEMESQGPGGPPGGFGGGPPGGGRGRRGDDGDFPGDGGGPGGGGAPPPPPEF